jgi:hypothetical protein
LGSKLAAAAGYRTATRYLRVEFDSMEIKFAVV